MKQSICVIVRVYNRVEDLEVNMEIIRKTWLLHNYYVIVSANGVKDGFNLSNKTIQLADKINIMDDNIGHLSGNSQLLLSALPLIPNFCRYTIILEADTWVYTDCVIEKYISFLENSIAVWASAKWYDKCFSLATDFAIIKTDYLKLNPDIFKFSKLPECYVANFLHQGGEKYAYIYENMPVHLPSYIKRYPYAPQGRFYVFPKSKMVTHHIEMIEGGIDEKKCIFNIVSKTNVLTHNYAKKMPYIELFKMKIARFATYLLPKRSWYKKNVYIYK